MLSSAIKKGCLYPRNIEHSGEEAALFVIIGVLYIQVDALLLVRVPESFERKPVEQAVP